MRVVLASRNSGKLEELRPILSPLGLTLESQAEHDVPSPDETGTTFVENAIIKARTVAEATRLPAVADDSGIVVPLLGGAPGIHSARFAGVGASDDDNNQKMIESIATLEDPITAYYFCAIVFFTSALDPTPLVATAAWHGTLLHEPRGSNGFGYDPYFVPDGYTVTSAELAPEEKNRISHRGLACDRLILQLQDQKQDQSSANSS
ncbi:MAG: RdgB/HAM1 family non-canonical purine NTP pyrophosphatase [Pseudomonadales bacterium]|nr:RdgB/HAM1 family non-canonical purine NTP pyrophosphatase [Pseudomonadales bacterium]